MENLELLAETSDVVPNSCFHCGEPVLANTYWTVNIDNHAQAMCCPGCVAVAQAIIDYGLSDFYKNRNAYQKKAEQIVPDPVRKLGIYDDPKFQHDFVHTINASQREANLILEGVVCPACIWLIESRLQKMKGIIKAQGNYTTHRLNIAWDETRIHLSGILVAISSLGYTAHPYEPAISHEVYEQQRKTLLKRIGLAGVLGMQVMMIAFALYASDLSGIQADMRALLYWLSLILTTPVVIYSGRSFFTGAWRDIRCFRLGMDVPVSLGISIAFIGSVYATVTNQGHIYYDSVVMFIFFLLTARYIEFMSRKKALTYIEKINKIIPATATKIVSLQQQNEITISVAEIQVDDILLVKPGETIPADGSIIEGMTSIDESIITGESRPLEKKLNDRVIAGSVNIDSPIKIKIVAVGENTVQSKICHLIEEAQQQKQAISELANTVAGWFVLFVLIIAGAVAWYWWHTDHAQWLPITISVLVVTCPCALSLATPTAITAATSLFMKYGIAIKRSNSIENLARVTDFLFDKTGTLTHGKPQLLKIVANDNKNIDKFHAIAAAMEKGSEHPLAKTISGSYWGKSMPNCKNIRNMAGYGLMAEINNVRYFIGSNRFILENTNINNDVIKQNNEQNTTRVLLANENELLCSFELEDTIRSDAKGLIDYLQQLNKKTMILSGDRQGVVQRVADELSIKDIHAELSPNDKLNLVNYIKQQGATVAVVGDGINDAPVLACADVSIAMGSGTDLAQMNADMILMNGSLTSLQKAIKTAYKTLQVIRQNIIWAIAYNLIALPVAAAGLLAPWMAALGMSLSSIIVVGNAARLSRE